MSKTKAKAKFEAGDITENEWGDRRVVWMVTEDTYLYIDWRKKEKTLFYNPTHSACAFAYMNQSHKKIGEAENLDELKKVMQRLSQIYGDAFIEAQAVLGNFNIKWQN